MASRQSIEAGRGHVTLGYDDGPLRRGLEATQQRFQTWGRNIMALGASVTAGGLLLAAPLVAGIRAFAPYEQALAELRAQANPTEEEFGRVRQAIENLAVETGTPVEEVTQGFTELLKAGRSLDEILGGLGKTAIQFARVGGLPMGEAVKTLSDAMNVFSKDGLTAAQIANIFSIAADTSTGTLRDMVAAFASGGAAMASYGGSAQDFAIAVGIMLNAGVDAASAGTSLKTLYMRLSGVSDDGTNDAADAVHELGLEYRDAHQRMLPLPQIIANIQRALAPLGIADRERLVNKLGGYRGVLGLNPLLMAGTAGWDAFKQKMQDALPIEQKFDILMNTLQSQLKRLMVQISLVAIAIGSALAPMLRLTIDLLGPLLGGVRDWILSNSDVVRTIGQIAFWTILAGLALTALGIAVYAVSYPIGVLIALVKLLWMASGIAVVGTLLWAAALWILKLALAVGMLLPLAVGWVLMKLWTAACFVASIGAATLAAAQLFAGVATLGLSADMTVLAAAEALATFGLNLLIGSLVIFAALAVASPFLVIAASLAYIGYTFARTAIGAAISSAEFCEAVSPIADAFYAIGDAAQESFDGIVSAAQLSWGAIVAAYKMGDWELLWELIQVTAQIAWEHMKFFGATVFYAIGDAIVDTFSRVMRELRALWVISWGEMHALALMTLAATARLVGANELARGFELDAARVRGNARREAGEIREDDPDAAERNRVRAARDAALRAGRDDEVARLNLRLRQLDAVSRLTPVLGLIMGLWRGGTETPLERQLRMMQEQGVRVQGLGGPGGPKSSARGTFSTFEAMGFLGAFGGAGGESRTERLAREQLDQQRRMAEALGNIERRPGLAMG